MNILVIDIGGNTVKAIVTGATEIRKFPSGPAMTPRQMVTGVRKLTEDWKYDAVSIGYPGRVRENRPVSEPANLGRGWIKFDYQAAFSRPVRMMNDAAMQAMGSYRGKGRMLFLGLGTGLGTALVIDGRVLPMEIQHLSYKHGTYEDYLGMRGLKRLGIRKWRDHFGGIVARFISGLDLDDVVIGGGNVKKLDVLPPGCRAGDNALAFRGGVLMWKEDRCGTFAPEDKRRGARHERTTRTTRRKKKLLKAA